MSIRDTILDPLLRQVDDARWTLEGPRQSGMVWHWRLSFEGRPIEFTTQLRKHDWAQWHQVAGFLTALVWLGPEVVTEILNADEEAREG